MAWFWMGITKISYFCNIYHNYKLTIMAKSFIYTRTGDLGTTSLVGGTRVSKDDARLEAYGTIDELSSCLGKLAVVTAGADPAASVMIGFIQNKLFNIGAYLATADAREAKGLSEDDIRTIEEAIDTVDGELPPLQCFVLPGGCREAAEVHVCRTVCRRAERRVVALMRQGIDIDPRVIKFLNRLSDWLFVLARHLNVLLNIEERPWQQ